ncbi:hypothetical protein H0H92_005854 [Tricholoma furcatifolium]|nr:hypothetical protein H0H92_005854 [Tricholoma furcatifolium]
MDDFMSPWSSGGRWLSSLPLATHNDASEPIVNDALIIWRAWVILSGKRWSKYILVAAWVMTTEAITSPTGNVPVSVNIANALSSSSTGLSFATNFLATAFIAYILRFDNRFFS